MAGRQPFFLTGANAIVKLNSKTMAYCQDVNYSVVIAHALPHVIGMYENISIEPLSYEVSGSFTVIRYANGVHALLGNGAPAGVNPGGNGVGQWGPDNLAGLVFGADGRAKDALDPSTFSQSTGFDIEIFQKVASAAGQTTVPVARLRSCRIARADFAIPSKSAPAVERFTFHAIYADEDSFNAGTSGDGQHFA